MLFLQNRALVFIAAVAIAAGVAGQGCAQAAQEHTVLQSDDLTSDPQGAKFDKNEILDSASFTDALGLDADQVQKFFHQTPYKRPSFLETYQSNGVRAVDAIIRVANTYRINPLVFIDRLEMAEGLIGEEFYPFPPARVEYVFACGCSAAGLCEPALAGLDKQLDCLGRALRTSLDEVKANGATSGGWGPNRDSVTIDGQKVTPADDSTSALYQYTPAVGSGKSANWLFWNIWQKYATYLDYQAPLGGTSGTAWIGDACTADPLCDYANGQCLQDARAPGGLCSFDCTTSDCPSDANHPSTFCANFASGDTSHGMCLLVCNPAAPVCRNGYKCVEGVQKYNDPNTTQAVCFN